MIRIDKNCTIESYPFGGGFRIVRATWYYDGRPWIEAWDQQIEFLDGSTFATKEGCEAAIVARYSAPPKGPNFMAEIASALKE